MPVLDNAIQRLRTSGKNIVTDRRVAPLWPWSGERTTSGAVVSEDTALALTSVYRATILIASSAGGLPIKVYNEVDEDNRQRVKTPSTAFVWRRPNLEMTKVMHWEQAFAHEVLNGNCFLFVEKNEWDGSPVSLWPIAPRRVRVGRTKSGQKVYEVDGEDPMIDYRQGGEIVHIPNVSLDGLIGLSPIQQGRQAVGLAASAEDYAARFYSGDATPRGVLTSEQELTDEESDRILARWLARYGTAVGAARTNRIAVLSKGAKFQPIQINPEDAQLLESRKYSVAEIARLFGVPPHMLYDVTNSTTWGSGLEEQSRGYVTYTLASHLTRFEQAIDDALLTRELTDNYVKFDTAGLLRGNLLQRYQAHALGYGRWLATNDIRRMEELPPVEGGDDVFAATNLVPIERLGEAPANAGTASGGAQTGGAAR